MPSAKFNLSDHPEISTVRVASVDLNGQWRGKRVPVAQAEKALQGGMRTPLSVSVIDIWGEDVADNPLVFADGDGDGILEPTSRGFVPMTWFDTPSALLPVWMANEDGTAFAGDPRRVLAEVLSRFAAHGWTPVVATELEFYLVADTGEGAAPATSPRSNRPISAADVLSLDDLDAHDAFFTDLYASCAAMDIPADAAISEGGRGQFEINLLHAADALKAADDAQLFKTLVRGLARKHGHIATFMPKPFADQSGNGMHVHFSILDSDGKNIFDDGSDGGSAVMRRAVGGLMQTMVDATLIFAPHLNSYRRLTPDSHAPTGVCWGYENRTTAIRIPGGPSSGRRIEHRVAGGDANPYLMLATILGAALAGIDSRADPGDPVNEHAYTLDIEQLPTNWRDAISAFSGSTDMSAILGPDIVNYLTLCKRQELRRFEAQMTDFELQTYLETV